MQTKDGIREEHWAIKRISTGTFYIFDEDFSLCKTEEEAKEFLDNCIPDNQLDDHAVVKVVVFETDPCEKCGMRRNSICRVACNCDFITCPDCNMTHRKGDDCACGSGITFAKGKKK